jgi:hypothetical protein
MKISYTNWITILNDRLKTFGQETRVVSYTKDLILLNTGNTLMGKDLKSFKGRIMNKATDLWVKNIDYLLLGVITEAQIKSLIYSIGGRNCQKLYGDKIRKNLNTGTPWNKNMKGSYPYSYACSEGAKEKISVANKGEKNGMFGKPHSVESKEKLSRCMRNKILTGKFTPNSNNRNTHWESVYKGKKYRSSWEAWYQCLDNQAEYESLRLEYNSKGKSKIYIVDFINRAEKKVVEVKPKELLNREDTIAKLAALEQWAKNNNYILIISTKEWLIENTKEICYTDFDTNTANKIRKIYEVAKKNRNNETQSSL